MLVVFLLVHSHFCTHNSPSVNRGCLAYLVFECLSFSYLFSGLSNASLHLLLHPELIVNHHNPSLHCERPKGSVEDTNKHQFLRLCKHLTAPSVRES